MVCHHWEASWSLPRIPCLVSSSENSGLQRQADIQDTVKAASPSPNGVLLSQLCGVESCESIVPTYQWDTFLGKFFKKLPSIKPQHHIKFMDGGIVECKLLSESEPTTHLLLKCNPEEVSRQTSWDCSTGPK